MASVLALAVKLGTLAVKTFCKPIANRLTREASSHPLFRQFIINLGRTNQKAVASTQRRIYGRRSTNLVARPLGEEEAVKAAAALLGEMLVFTVTGSVIIYDFASSGTQSEMKEEIQEVKTLANAQVDLLADIKAKFLVMEHHAQKQVEHLADIKAGFLVIEAIEHHAQKQVELEQKQVEHLADIKAGFHVIEAIEQHAQKQVEHLADMKTEFLEMKAILGDFKAGFLAIKAIEVQGQKQVELLEDIKALATKAIEHQEHKEVELRQDIKADLAHMKDDLAQQQAEFAKKQEQQLAALAAEYRAQRQIPTFSVNIYNKTDPHDDHDNDDM